MRRQHLNIIWLYKLAIYLSKVWRVWVCWQGMGMCTWERDQTIPYSFNHIPPFIFRNAHLTLVKHTGLVSFDHCSEIYVSLSSCVCQNHLHNYEKYPNTYVLLGTRTCSHTVPVGTAQNMRPAKPLLTEGTTMFVFFSIRPPSEGHPIILQQQFWNLFYFVYVYRDSTTDRGHSIFCFRPQYKYNMISNSQRSDIVNVY